MVDFLKEHEYLINKIWQENCLNTMAKMPDSFIDLTVTSPPYDSLRLYKGYNFQFEKIAKELFRVTKQGGIVVWVIGDSTIDGSETLTSCKQKIFFREECGFNIHDTMIYEKNGFSSPSNNRYHQVFEYMFVLSKETPKTFNPIKDRKNIWEPWGKNTRRQQDGELKETQERKTYIGNMGMRYNIWRFNVGGSGMSTPDKIAYQHPAIYPEDLAQDHIRSWSNEGDLIYDPFGGSGTTVKMCILLKRKYIMSEISAEYCEIAEKRIKPYKDQLILI